MDQAPALEPNASLPESLPAVSVIIPAYNEAVNIADCMAAVLQSELPSSSELQVIVADDESSDDTRALAEAIAAEEPRVQVIAVPPRPTDTVWRGKNWACANAVQQATGDYWLFIDADVRLEPQAIATTLQKAEQEQIDLLSCAPNVACGCLAEWLVQPIMISLLAIGFSFEGVNDPEQRHRAFAAGPFMLFRRATYEAIGGHQAVADDLVEDVALARLIKRKGHRLHYTLALDLLKVRMYQNFSGLWEGWTKNYYVGSGRNLFATLYSAFAVTAVFVLPWLGMAIALACILAAGPATPWLAGTTLVLAASAIALQYCYRLQSAQRFGLPFRYGWLGWLSGLLVAAIAIGSIIKTETGWGWTWRGRSLAVQEPIQEPK
ncbi:MAG: glycosyltransferase [Leptolyngbyaceae cyanobacterium SM1_1_3]|nr:glycosyltransferase [Leptolyngbyaceae cyanobacterium SM1_1_3]